MSDQSHDERLQNWISEGLRSVPPRPTGARALLTELRAELSDYRYWIGWTLSVWFIGSATNRGWLPFAAIVWVVTLIAWVVWRGVIVAKHDGLQSAAVVFATMITAW